MRLNRKFFNRDPILVAPDLLGKILIHKIEENFLSGRIVETEAYLASNDPASHAYKGKTKKNKSLFLRAGHIYVYTIHVHNILNVVCEEKNIPGSVLIRAIEPIAGIEIMRKFRNSKNLINIANGPGKLCKAFNIKKNYDGADITSSRSKLFITRDSYIPQDIVVTKRIGIKQGLDKNYRFFIKENKYVSKL